MDLKLNNLGEIRSGSFGRTSSAGSSLRRRSCGVPGSVPSQIDDDLESETVSQAGDIGDRALHSNRVSESGSFRISVDYALESGVAVPIQENSLLKPNEIWAPDATANTAYPATSSPLEIISPLSADALACLGDEDEVSAIRIFYHFCISAFYVNFPCL